MKILVTGATGLLGSHLVEVLQERGYEPRALVEPGGNDQTLAAAGVEVCIGDVRESESLRPALSNVEWVLNCAARTGPWGPEQEYESTNVRGLQTLVDEAMAAGVRRIVHVSSITVHGNDVGGTADETAPLRGEPNPYSRSKVAGELLLRRMIQQEGAPVTIVRPGWIYGPRDSASFARFATKVREGKMVMIGSGDNHLPLIYVRDAAIGVVQAADSPDAVGQAYLLVNDEPVTQRQFLGAIAAELGVPAPRKRLPYRLALAVGGTAERVARSARREQPPPVMRYGIQLLGGDNRFSIAKARRDLEFNPHVSVHEGVKRSVEWFRTEESGRDSALSAARAG